MNWVNGIRGRDQVTSPFSYAAHLNEIMLLGVASLRAKSKLYYDGAPWSTGDSATQPSKGLMTQKDGLKTYTAGTATRYAPSPLRA